MVFFSAFGAGLYFLGAEITFYRTYANTHSIYVQILGFVMCLLGLFIFVRTVSARFDGSAGTGLNKKSANTHWKEIDIA